MNLKIPGDFEVIRSHGDHKPYLDLETGASANVLTIGEIQISRLSVNLFGIAVPYIEGLMIKSPDEMVYLWPLIVSVTNRQRELLNEGTTLRRQIITAMNPPDVEEEN